MTLRFVSTRGAAAPVGWADAIDGGTAPDGGLWVPTTFPRTFARGSGAHRSGAAATVDEFGTWAAARAVTWFDDADHEAALARALDLPVRLRPLGDRIDLLDLTGGPTGAFKDVGARVLATLWSRSARPAEESRTVLTATSGDTGGAVAAAVEGVRGLTAVIVFPLGRVSDVQRRQFTTRGPQIRALAIDGTFDDCQAVVRAAFADRSEVVARGLVSANSINPGRLMPQTLYYGWLADVAPLRPVVVPSGNLGNVAAAVLARELGAELGRVHAVVNENDALVRAARGGAPGGGPAVRTDSSAMDVARPSNLERLSWLADRRGATLAELVHPASVRTDDARRAQRWAFDEHGVMVDPHTAVGVARALDLLDANPECRPVVVETAHPAKFPEIVREVTGAEPPVPPLLERSGDERWTRIEAEGDALFGAIDAGRSP